MGWKTISLTLIECLSTILSKDPLLNLIEIITRLEVVTVFKERESESQTERQQALPGDPAPASERGSKKFDFPPQKNMMLN